MKRPTVDDVAWGWLPPLTLVSGCGLLLMAAADNGGRNNTLWATPLFWLSLLMLVTPTALRLGMQQVSRKERLGLVVMLGLGLYLVKVLRDPSEFTYYDELEFWPAINSILVTDHLFHSDALYELASYYPGLQILVSALAQVGRLSIFQSGLLIVGAARLVLSVALFMLYERIGNSTRIAALAVLIYMTNPNFLFFDAQCAYESLSLGLAALTLLLAVDVVGGRGIRGKSTAPRASRGDARPSGRGRCAPPDFLCSSRILRCVGYRSCGATT